MCSCIKDAKGSLGDIQVIEAALKWHDMLEGYSWWLTDPIAANHSNYLVCDRANTQSVTVRKVVKLQLQLQCPRN